MTVPSILDKLRVNLDVVNPAYLESVMLLLHGDYGVGKSHFVLDAMREEAKNGPVAIINVKGEDGLMTGVGMGLGETAYTVSSTDELEKVVAALRGLKLRLLGLDSLKMLAALTFAEITGGRMPDKSDYIPLHWKFPRLLAQLRGASKYVIATSPSDKSVEQLTGRTRITPDLPGRQAIEAGGKFDFVGYLQADIVGPNKVQRRLILTPNSAIVTRQRLPKPIPDQDVPAGGGGWLNFRTALDKAIAEATKGAA